MTDFLILVGLVGEVVILVCLDHRIYGTWLSPTAVLGVPYVFVVILTRYVAPLLEFIPLNMESVFYWMIGLLVFWGAGLIVGLKMGPRIRSSLEEPFSFRGEAPSQTLALVLAWLSILMLVASFRSTLSFVGGWGELGTEEFARTYGYGVSGHVLTFLIPLLVLLIGVLKKSRKIIWLTILFGLFLAIAYQVKSWIMVPILGGIIYRYISGRLKLSIGTFVQGTVAVVAVFLLSYLIGFGTRNLAVFWDLSLYPFLFKHLMSYLFSGVLAFGEIVRNGVGTVPVDAEGVFAAFINLWRVITSGDFVNFVDPSYVVIDVHGTYLSNVHTLFGALVIYLGSKAALVYTLYMGLISYLVFAWAMIGRNCWVGVLWAFLASLLSLGWFDLYFWHLNIVEIPAYCLIIALAVSIFGRWRSAGNFTGLNRKL